MIIDYVSLPTYLNLVQTYYYGPEIYAVILPAERPFSVAAEDRFEAISQENRIIAEKEYFRFEAISQENRSIVVKGENRYERIP